RSRLRCARPPPESSPASCWPSPALPEKPRLCCSPRLETSSGIGRWTSQPRPCRCKSLPMPSRPTTNDTGRHGRERWFRSEEHTSELQSHHDLVCRLLLEKKKKIKKKEKHTKKQHKQKT